MGGLVAGIGGHDATEKRFGLARPALLEVGRREVSRDPRVFRAKRRGLLKMPGRRRCVTFARGDQPEYHVGIHRIWVGSQRGFGGACGLRPALLLEKAFRAPGRILSDRTGSQESEQDRGSHQCAFTRISTSSFSSAFAFALACSNASSARCASSSLPSRRYAWLS